MKYSTLSYLHNLLIRDITVRRSALELTKSAYNKKVDEADGMSNRKEAEKHVAASKALYDAAREDLCRAEQAFADFNEHDFR